jgi:hypothetical protein
MNEKVLLFRLPSCGDNLFYLRPWNDSSKDNKVRSSEFANISAYFYCQPGQTVDENRLPVWCGRVIHLYFPMVILFKLSDYSPGKGNPYDRYRGHIDSSAE